MADNLRACDRDQAFLLPVGCRNSFMQLVGGTRGADR
jgi:hypothetical protein